MYTIKENSSVTNNDFFKNINQQSFVFHKKQKSDIDNPIRNSFNKLNKSNSTSNFLKYQSPKLTGGILRTQGN